VHWQELERKLSDYDSETLVMEEEFVRNHYCRKHCCSEMIKHERLRETNGPRDGTISKTRRNQASTNFLTFVVESYWLLEAAPL